MRRKERAHQEEVREEKRERAHKIKRRSHRQEESKDDEAR